MYVSEIAIVAKPGAAAPTLIIRHCSLTFSLSLSISLSSLSPARDGPGWAGWPAGMGASERRRYQCPPIALQCPSFLPPWCSRRRNQAAVYSTLRRVPGKNTGT